MASFSNQLKNISPYTNKHRSSVVLATESSLNIITQDGYELLIDVGGSTNWANRNKN